MEQRGGVASGMARNISAPVAPRGRCGEGVFRVYRGAPVDPGLLSGEAGVVFVVLSVECAAAVARLGGRVEWRRSGGSPTSISAGGSTGAAGDGIADGIVVARARCEATGPANAGTGLLASGLWLFQRGQEMDVGVRGRGAYLVRGAAAGAGLSLGTCTTSLNPVISIADKRNSINSSSIRRV